jgi:D-alanine-D-alanine ligase
MPHNCGYEAKWAQADARYAGTAGVCPAMLADALQARIELWSTLAFRALGLRDYARIDWRLSPTRGLMALEANPNPDISPASGFLRSVRAAGMDYPEFIGLLIEETLARG